MSSLQLEIVTPDALVLHKDVDYVGVPGAEGEFGILPGHIPFLSALTVGGLYYKAEGETHHVFISGGFAEVSGDKLIILADAAEPAENIDQARALAAKERAESRLADRQESIDIERAKAALCRAMSRISLHHRTR